MSIVLRGCCSAAVASLLLLGPRALAQPEPNLPPNPNFRVTPVVPGAQAPGMPPAGIQSPYVTAAQQAALSSPYLSSGTSGVGSLNSTSPYTPYGGYLPPPYFPYMTPTYGALRGIADVTQANASWQATIQQARIIQQQANQAAIDTRRKMFDQIRYERMSMPTPEDIRVREMEVALSRSRRNPPLTEIWSADALNSLFNFLAKTQAQGFKGPRVDLDEDTLRHVNLTDGTGGNIGLLRDGGKLLWPVSLQRPEYADAEKSLGQLLPDAIQVVKFGNPLPENVRKDIEAAMTGLNDRLNKNISELTPSQYIESRRYLNYLKEGMKALEKPDAAKYFGKWTAKGRTVAELIKNMSDNGLKFAPATPGDEAAYRALYNALIAYDDGIAQVARQP